MQDIVDAPLETQSKQPMQTLLYGLSWSHPNSPVKTYYLSV